MWHIFFILFRFFLLLLGTASVVYILSVVLPGTTEELLAGMEGSGVYESEQSKHLFFYVKEFVLWIWGLLRFDLGTSTYLGIPIIDLIISHWAITIFLNSLSWGLALLCSICIVWILFRYQHIDIIKKLYTVLETILLSFTPLTISVFVLSIIVFFDVPIPLFYVSNNVSIASVLRYLIPLCILIVLQIPLYVRSLLKAVTTIQDMPFVQFAHSLGYSQLQVWKYDILPNALLYTISISSIQLSILLGGSILIEFNFAIPGLGTLLVNAISSRDLLLMRNIILLYGTIVGGVHIGLKVLHKRYFNTVSYKG